MKKKKSKQKLKNKKKTKNVSVTYVTPSFGSDMPYCNDFNRGMVYSDDGAGPMK